MTKVRLLELIKNSFCFYARFLLNNIMLSNKNTIYFCNNYVHLFIINKELFLYLKNNQQLTWP